MGQKSAKARLLRNMEMERRRLLYESLKLETLFKEKGLSSSDFPRDHYLPLEIFDDEKYECRTAKEWMSLGMVDGKSHPIPAEALFQPPDYETVAVTEYNENLDMWEVISLDGERRTSQLPRIYLRFFGEDPRIFVERVANALEERKRAEALMRYNLYLDCIPTEGMESLTESVKDEILRLTVNTGNLRRFQESYYSLIMKETERNYKRVMCDLNCRRLLRNHYSLSDFFAQDLLSPQCVPKIQICRVKHFQEVKELIEWHTLYVQSQIYEIMKYIVEMRDKASVEVMFLLKYGKPVSIEEFEVQQLQKIHGVVNYLKNHWIQDIAQWVKMNLRDVGKGWFDFKQRNYEIYKVMKLKRLLELIKQHMQTALRNLIENSSALFLSFFETPSLCLAHLKPDFVWDDDLKSKQFERANLTIFEVELNMNDKSTFFTPDPNTAKDKLDYLLVFALQLSEQIKQIQSTILENLKFSNDLFINSVSIQEESICEIRKRIKAAYNKCMIPMFAYLKKMETYRSLYSFNIERYVQDFENSDYTTSSFKIEILKQRSLKADLENDLPSTVVIGPFKVNLDKLKRTLINKREDIINSLFDMYTKNLRSQVEVMLNDFRTIFRKLSMEPATVEQLFELREWMEGIPTVVTEHFENFQKLKVEYDVLDTLLWNISDEDFEVRYEAMHFPHRIKIKVDQLQASLTRLEKDKFFKIHEEDEAEMEEKIDYVLGSVTNIATQSDIKKIVEIAAEINKTWAAMKEMYEFCVILNARQKLFGVPVVPFTKLVSLIKDFEPYKNFWLTANEWLKWYYIWMEEPLVTIDGTGIDTKVNEMYKMISKSIKIFQNQADLAYLAEQLKIQIEFFKPYISVIQALRNPGIRPRHLEIISNQTEIAITMSRDLTFRQLLELNIMDFTEIIKDVSETAAKEFAIEEALAKMKSDWQTLEMEVVPYKSSGTYTMKVLDEIQLLLDDHILNTQQITFSPFKEVFNDEVDEWYKTLKLSQDVINLWMEVQKLWMYLEPIFTSEDISKQLPFESKKYNTLDRNWRRIMKSAYENPVIIKICADRTLLESLRECMNLLEVVQKGLADYLESRRILFPRFFFLSDDELLEILAQTKNVQAVQPHLKKCFENMHRLRFEPDLLITRMYSAEKEEVVLHPPVRPIGSVEYWLNTVESSMRTTVQYKISQALDKVEIMPRKKWIYLWPGQVSLCGGQTSWTGHVENAIMNNSLKDCAKMMISQLDDLRNLVRGQQTDIQRMMLEAIITIEVHARDVLLKLVHERVSNVNDFDWISQLRYYWVNGTDLKVRAVNAEFQYGYEYLGNNGRLVITPLTDRCYLTLTGALHLKFGGAPAGPAGTGKTETTKDLAKALAIQCVVFNCSDQLDFISMGKFFKGLASSGAWACFDEFNRIDIEVLSVIAQQLMTIQKAQQLHAEKFIFEGVELRLIPTCAAFITMNPGYAGRTELPDNLKALFRPVAMMVPNYALIAEISLFSCGFSDAKSLAAKITATFKLSSEQLSSQDHYDFGMRSVKTVIAVAGILKREQKDMEEAQICLRSLRDVNVPKFLKDDLILFNGIVSDLFPNVVEKSIDYDVFVDAIKDTLQAMKLKDVPEFIYKIIQLYETTIVRHGLMLVGPTGAGKTKVCSLT